MDRLDDLFLDENTRKMGTFFTAKDSGDTPPLGIRMERYFTKEGVHPYDEVEWEKRVAQIKSSKGEIIFEQKDVEMPKFWSQTATDIVAEKYFAGHVGKPGREKSLRELLDRVADTITGFAVKSSYFASHKDSQIFNEELKFLLLRQMGSFNSPVWFNVGVEKKPQCSACFILSVEDNKESIAEWYRTEMMIFSGGSGSGINISPLRSSYESISNRGKSSGPVSFMKGADAIAGTIRSGGKTRRAAKMVILNADHPDVESFIVSKWKEEEKAKALIQMGYDDAIDGEIYTNIFFQNANNSVRATDEFMEAVEKDKNWELKAVRTGEIVKEVKAGDLMGLIAEAAWHCADPGMQFDTTINKWHTCPGTGRINGSNPCFAGDTLIYTDKGLVKFAELYKRAQAGERFRVYTHNATNKEKPEESLSLTSPTQIFVTGINDIYRLVFSNGMEIKATPNHRFFTKNRGMVPASELQPKDQIALASQDLTFDKTSSLLDLDSAAIFAAGWGGRQTKEYKPVNLPTAWTVPLAHYIGFLIGDGSLQIASGPAQRLSAASVIFGNKEEADELRPQFTELFREWGVNDWQNLDMPNGTTQLRIHRTPVARFLSVLGVSDKKAPEKAVPFSVYEAPQAMQAAFLRGLFTADGCVYDGEKHRYVGLGSVSKNLLLGAQQLLLSQGIFSRIYKIKKSGGQSFSYTKKDGTLMNYQNHQSYDLRISGKSIARFKEKIGFLTERKQIKLNNLVANHDFYDINDTWVSLVSSCYEGKEFTYNLTEPKNHSYIANGLIVANCSEYMHLDNSACNLASLNLLKFVKSDGNFDTESYQKAIRIFIIAQDAVVDHSSYPTEKIEKNARAFRQLGLGYCNIGALMMRWGYPYDSPEARANTGALTSVLSGMAYATSAEISKALGPFAGYTQNHEPMLNVIQMHGDEARQIEKSAVRPELWESSQKVWERAYAAGKQYGVRNSQVTVLAPTGTISFMMDADTTGIEPAFSLVAYKKMVGGGFLKIANKSVEPALKNLGYPDAETKEIMDYILANDSIEGATGLKEEHLPVFDCATYGAKGKRAIPYMGHVRMMAAAQPFISGAISKTVNLPESATVEDVMNTYLEAWRLGLKAIAIYRDNSKGSQPLNTSDKKSKKDEEASVQGMYQRRKLPADVKSIRHKFSVAGHEGYIHCGLYEDGALGEVFIRMSKEGSTIAGLLESIGVLMSISLQSGVPVETIVRKFAHWRFEPAGYTENPDILIAKSLLDYIARFLAIQFLPAEARMEFGIYVPSDTEEKSADKTEEQPLKLPASPSLGGPASPYKVVTASYSSFQDAPACRCGNIMQRTGSCYTCSACGNNLGSCS